MILQRAIINNMIAIATYRRFGIEHLRTEFFDGDYASVFSAIKSTDTGDMLTISNESGVGMPVLAEWMVSDETTGDFGDYCIQLREDYGHRQRGVLSSQLRMVETIEDGETVIRQYLASVEPADKSEPKPLKEIIGEGMKELERRHSADGIIGMPTGLYDLDDATEGLHRGDLVVIAGPPSMGKTAFAISLAEAVAASGEGVLIHSLEMTDQQLYFRSLATASGVPMGRIRSARFQEADWARMTNGINLMHEWPIWVDDTAGCKIGEIERKVRKWKRKHNIGLVVVDYLQIMGYDKNRENQAIGEITGRLKNLAKTEKVCVVLLSQLSRGSQKEKRKPGMSDLRGSGMIEADADVILFPWRPNADCEECQEKAPDHNVTACQAKSEIIIGKQRQGERNISIETVWIGSLTRFTGKERDHEPY